MSSPDGSAAPASSSGTRPSVFRVVLTGGPCAGKTTALSALRTRLTDLGLHVVTVPENATMVFGNSGGYWPGWASNREHHIELQRTLLLLQVDIETRMLAIAELHARSKDVQVVLLCDRGVLDGKAFCEEGEWEKVSASAGLSEADMIARYDMVCHLVTAAKGAAEHYEYGAGSRNPSRFHNPEQAVEADEKGLEGWAAHQRLEVIDNSTPFDQKVKRVLRRICRHLHLPLPSHAPLRRFELFGPILDDVFRKAGVRVTRTSRTIHSLEDNTFALRVTKHDRGDGDVAYTRAERKGEATCVRNELANERQYDALVRESGRKVTHTVVRSFVWQGQYMELNEYPKKETAEGNPDMSLDIEPADEEEHQAEEEPEAGRDVAAAAVEGDEEQEGEEGRRLSGSRLHGRRVIPEFLLPFWSAEDSEDARGGADRKRRRTGGGGGGASASAAGVSFLTRSLTYEASEQPDVTGADVSEDEDEDEQEEMMSFTQQAADDTSTDEEAEEAEGGQDAPSPSLSDADEGSGAAVEMTMAPAAKQQQAGQTPPPALTPRVSGAAASARAAAVAAQRDL